ncbi:MAG: hypothetical protein M3N14_02220, partial [Bacteroidota bacterium]|nr:hypothetical protein [Bacteroidota bacterium]
MKILLSLAACCFMITAVWAQSAPQTLTVKGIVIDTATSKPLGYVTVALQDAKTHQSVKGALTKED